VFIERQSYGNNSFVVHCFVEHDVLFCEEFLSLAYTSEANVVDEIRIQIRKISPSTYLSKGKVEAIKEKLLYLESQDKEVDLILIDAILKPSQEKNLEAELGIRVVDRTGLILDVFAKHASSNVGKIQVELAQLQFISTRLIGAWSHLERQKGGIGLRGPGESQLETDKQLIKKRLSFLKKKLAKISSQRQQNYKHNKDSGVFIIALVGYTNAGKSSLHRCLCDSSAKPENKLFSTLDSMSRAVNIDNKKVVITDTVGFINNIPHQLIESFHSTLERVCEADLILHVIDISEKNMQIHIDVVNSVLNQINANKINKIKVFNKIDKLGFEQKQESCISVGYQENSVCISANEKEGIGVLVENISEFLFKKELSIRAGFNETMSSKYKIISEIYKLSSKITSKEKSDENGASVIEFSISKKNYKQLLFVIDSSCQDNLDIILLENLTYVDEQ
jgi:GTP-binding protein HflX